MLYHYANLSVPVGRFQARAHLLGDVSRSGGSLLLQDLGPADQGTYTCEIRLERESLVVKKAVVLHVLPAEPRGACRGRAGGAGPPQGARPGDQHPVRRGRTAVTLFLEARPVLPHTL